MKKRFYTGDECPECRGTGFYPDAETECDCCRETYVEILEQMVAQLSTFGEIDDGFDAMFRFAIGRVNERRPTK